MHRPTSRVLSCLFLLAGSACSAGTGNGLTAFGGDQGDPSVSGTSGVVSIPTTTDPTTDASAEMDGGTVDGSGPGDSGDSGDDGPGDSGDPGGGAPEPCVPECGEGLVCVSGACTNEISGVPQLDQVLFDNHDRFDNEILISEQPDLTWVPSTLYRWHDFLQAAALMHINGVAGNHLWLGDEADPDELRAQMGLVNLAAFLAQSMKETIRYDACDENNWDNTNGYQISNACGQLGQDYADYDCEMACPQDLSMSMSAVTSAKWYGAPGPMFCAPDSELMAAGLMGPDGRTGRWNHGHDCWPYPATEPGFTPSTDPVYLRPDCEVYEGQRGGRYEWDSSGDSVEGCCWWGRGVIQTTGRCNFGTINHFLGQSHLDPGRFPHPSQVLYPEIDFCADPEVICASPDHPELKWIAGLFYWMTSVQDYDEEGWSYREQLRSYVESGLTGTDFIDAVSGIVNRGCHNPPCATGPVDAVQERRDNFAAVLGVMEL